MLYRPVDTCGGHSCVLCRQEDPVVAQAPGALNGSTSIAPNAGASGSSWKRPQENRKRKEVD